MAGKTKPALLAACLIGACAVAFNTMAGAAAAGELGKTRTVPTEYAAVKTAAPLPGDGLYQKPAFSVHVDSARQPDANAIRAQEAADIGARMIYYAYNVDMDGAVFAMEYVPVDENIRRAYWQGTFEAADGAEYYFNVDAITGEEFAALRARTLKESADLGFDRGLEENPDAYLALARQYAERFHLVGDAVESVTYAGQGYTNNDPTIDIDVLGADGLKGRLSFSRHDQALLTVEFNASCIERAYFEQKCQQEAEEALRNMEAQGIDIEPGALVPIAGK